MLTNFSASHSIVSEWIQEIRDVSKQDNRMQFRRNIERIGEVAAYEISKHLEYTHINTQTPLGIAKSTVIKTQPVIATILRAGLPLYQGLLHFFDKADSAFIGAYRKHGTEDAFEICQEYMASPKLEGRPLIVADPMLATGASLALALTQLTAYDHPSEIHIVAVIASAAGIEHIERHFPKAHIWVAAIDDELTAKGYIVPGLGDAGDLAYGEKRQA